MGAEAPSIRQEGKCSLVLVGDPGENEDSVSHTEMADNKYCGFAEICSYRGRLGALKPHRQGLLNIWLKPNIFLQKAEEKSEILKLCPFSKL